MTPDYMASLSKLGSMSLPTYNPLGGDYHGSYTSADLLKNQENGLNFMDSVGWDGEQTGIGGYLDQKVNPNGSWWDSFNFFDKTENGVKTQGAGGLMLGGLSAGMNAYLGMKQYGLAKDTLKHNKDMFAKNFDAQRRTTNASLEDRQRSRVASNAGAYESVGSYMDKNRIL